MVGRPSHGNRCVVNVATLTSVMRKVLSDSCPRIPMGKKSKSKTKQKKAAKAALKKAGVKNPTLKQSSALVKKSEKSGLDVGSLIKSGVSGIPFVGSLAEEALSQSGVLDQFGTQTGGQVSGGRGGARGVMMIDAKTGLNLGVISRRRALRMLSRTKVASKSRRVAILRSGEQVVKI